MPYDPQQMMNISRLGLGMAQPAFQDPVQVASGRPPGRPKQWWEQLPPQQGGGAPAGPGQSAGQSANPPKTLLDMLLATGGKGGLGGLSAGNKGGSDLDRPSLGPIPSMGMANMPASMWSQFTGMFPGGGWGGGGG